MRELIQTSEVYDPKIDEFLHTVVFWKEGEAYYRAELPRKIQKNDFSWDDIPLSSEPIDMTLMNGIWKPGLSVFDVSQQENLQNFHIKSPSLKDYGVGFPTGDLIINEAIILEKLKDLGLHPNICEYYGCVRSGQYVTGLVLKKYERNLREMEAKLSLDQRQAIFAGILAGVRYLHDHAFVHNDLRPENIMLDENGISKIIDFDSCLRIGDNSVRYLLSGCYEWTRDFKTINPLS